SPSGDAGRAPRPTSGTNGHALDDREMAAAFGRPADGSDDAGGRTTAAPRPDRGGTREPSVALASAFGRPQGAGEPLQRPAGPPGRTGDAPDDLWDGETAERDPWRDPSAPVELGAPAVREGEPGPD